MATAARPIVSPEVRPSRLAAFWRNTIGKKFVMAVTGIVLAAYVLVHMLGNLQVYDGPDRINAYGRFLRVAPPLLWTARIILLAALVIHATAGVQLDLLRRRARPIEYAAYMPVASSAASRSMIWSGLLILLFVVYHLLDLTVGVANPDFIEGDIYHNVVVSLGRFAGAAAYVIAMVALAFHLWHGLWSMFQSLGVSNARLTPPIQRAAATLAVIIALGFISIPVAVLVGLVR
jgi:succinate dehydrogenase / fumarate reductase cytochrome b subunit